MKPSIEQMEAINRDRWENAVRQLMVRADCSREMAAEVLHQMAAQSHLTYYELMPQAIEFILNWRRDHEQK